MKFYDSVYATRRRPSRDPRRLFARKRYVFASANDDDPLCLYRVVGDDAMRCAMRA